MADRIVADDDEIDLLSLQVEEGCVDTLVRDQPVVSPQTFAMSSVRCMPTLTSSAVGRSVRQHREGGRPPPRRAGPTTTIRDLIARMSAQAVELFHRSAVAWKARDVELAISIDELDDLLDELHYHYIQHVIQGAPQGRARSRSSRCSSPSSAGSTSASATMRRTSANASATSSTAGVPSGQPPNGPRPAWRAPSSSPRRPGLAVIDQIAEERRIDAIRRDFVANVSHELKTPVGAISLLADTISTEADPGGPGQRCSARC